jgi:hypothetical protein
MYARAQRRGLVGRPQLIQADQQKRSLLLEQRNPAKEV